MNMRPRCVSQDSETLSKLANDALRKMQSTAVDITPLLPNAHYNSL